MAHRNKNLSDPTYYSPSNKKTNPLPILARAHSPLIHTEVKQKEKYTHAI